MRAIENDCAVIPIGAVKLTPAHELRFDDSFRGLTKTEAASLDNWQHFRDPQSFEKISEIGD